MPVLSRYNGLVPIEQQVRLQDNHAEDIKAILAIIKKYGMGNLFGVHSLHRHGQLPEKTIRLETAAPGIDGMNWTRARTIARDPLAQDNIHATFFKVQGSTLVPFEFSEGPSPIKGQEIPPQFIADFAKYLFEHNLTDLMAIELKDFTKPRDGSGGRTSELDVAWGTIENLTVVLPFDQMVRGVTNPVPTGWNLRDYNPESDPEGPGPGEHWNQATKPDGTKTHKVHVDSLEPITAELLYGVLVSQGIVNKA